MSLATQVAVERRCHFVDWFRTAPTLPKYLLMGNLLGRFKGIAAGVFRVRELGRRSQVLIAAGTAIFLLLMIGAFFISTTSSGSKNSALSFPKSKLSLNKPHKETDKEIHKAKPKKSHKETPKVKHKADGAHHTTTTITEVEIESHEEETTPTTVEKHEESSESIDGKILFEPGQARVLTIAQLQQLGKNRTIAQDAEGYVRVLP